MRRLECLLRYRGKDISGQEVHPVYLLETFIDPQRFRGVSYQAANWRLLGWTTGRGKDAPPRQPNRPLKQLWVFPLVEDFRAKLRQGHG